MYAIISPCYNEGDSIIQFLEEIENRLKSLNQQFIVIIIDDFSEPETTEILRNFSFKSNLFEIRVYKHLLNQGHQQAIRTGLNCAMEFKDSLKGLFIIDSDGEDNPEGIFEVVNNAIDQIVIFERGKRSENSQFKIGYAIYKSIFKLLTGHSIKGGNFSYLPIRYLNGIQNSFFVHYYSFLSKLSKNIIYLKFDRRPRIGGESKMNFRNLVLHGLFSFIEFSEEILYQSMKIILTFIGVLFGYFIYVIYSKLVTFTAVPGWATTVAIGLIISILILLNSAILGLLLISIKRKTFNDPSKNRFEKIK